MRTHRVGALGLLLLAGTALAASSKDTLRRTSDALEALTRRVSPAVVKILVTGYGPVSEEGHQNTGLIGRQHAIGSGVIVDPGGYIVTTHTLLRARSR
jgi:serine protease Do